MPSGQTQIHALESLGMIAMACILLMGLSMAFMGLAMRDGSGRTTSIGCFTMWIRIIATLTWFAFDPAIRAMRFVNSLRYVPSAMTASLAL